MDKSKTLETLRGMKFMQRKEEAKRRALYEVEQSKDIERRVQAAQRANVKRQKQGPTILYEDSCPLKMYQYSRFKTAPSRDKDITVETKEENNNEEPVEEALNSLKRKREEKASDSESENGSGSSDDESYGEDPPP